MASLLSSMGLTGASGLPFTLSDDDLDELQQQQQAAQSDPTSGVSALMGVSGQDSTSAQQTPIPTATQQSLLGSLSQGATDSSKDNVGSDANPSYDSAAATDNSGSGSESNGSASVDDDNSSNTDTSASAGVDATSDSSNSDASTDSSASSQSPGFMSKLMGELKSNPTLGESLMNAGFGMMAASRYGTPGLAAVGMGAQQGIQTYNALKQQQVQNQMAVLNYQRQAAMDSANVNAKNATTHTTQLANQSKVATQRYFQQAGQNATIQGAIAAGALPQDAIQAYQGMHPELTMNTDDAGNVYAFNKQTGTNSLVGKSTKIVNTPAGNTTTAYNGSAGNGQPNSTVVQQGGLTPDQVNTNVGKYQATQQAATAKSQQTGQFLNQLQTADALAGSGGGAWGKGVRSVEQNLGFNDPNSVLRQQYAATNVQSILSGLPSGSRMDQNFLKLAEQTVSDPEKATPENMLRTTALLKSKADFDSVDSAARAAYVGQNGGMETPNKKAMTLNINGQSMNVPANTPIQSVSDAATSKLVDWDPPLVNPKWADGRNQQDINQALAYAKQSPAQLQKLRDSGILLSSNMRNGS